jgi:hypothetical protein
MKPGLMTETESPARSIEHLPGTNSCFIPLSSPLAEYVCSSSRYSSLVQAGILRLMGSADIDVLAQAASANESILAMDMGI